MLTKEELSKLTEPDAEYAALIAQNPVPDLPWDKIEALRGVSGQSGERAVAAMGPTPSDVTESIMTVRARDGYELSPRVVRPKSKPAQGSPLIVLIHGGGHIMGQNVGQIPLARDLAQRYGAVTAMLHYRLAPEHPFPTGSQDVIDSLEWFAANAESVGADPSRGFIVGGSSAGGQLSAVAAQHYVDKAGPGPKLTGLWQNITAVLASSIVPDKYREHYLSRTDPSLEHSAILNTRNVGAIDLFWKPDHKSPLFSPFNSPTAHRGMPRTYFQVCGQDPLRDDSFVYQDALQCAGVDTKIDVYPGLPHGFNGFFPTLKASQKWRADFERGMGWLLGESASSG